MQPADAGVVPDGGRAPPREPAARLGRCPFTPPPWRRRPTATCSSAARGHGATSCWTCDRRRRRPGPSAELEDPLLDVSQSILAEVDLVPDEERRCPERAALDRALSVREKLVLDRTGLGQLDESCAIQPRLLERRAEHAWIVHLLGIGPHVSKDLGDVAVEHAE